MDENVKKQIAKLVNKTNQPAIKKFTSVVSDSKNRPFLAKIIDGIFEGDPLETIGSLKKQLVRPYIQRFTYEYLNQFLQGVIFGKDKVDTSSNLTSRVIDFASSAATYHRQNALAREAMINSRMSIDTQPKQLFEPVIMLTKEAAEDFLAQMKFCIKEHGKVTVNEINSWRDMAGTSIDSNWGWTSLGDVPIKRRYADWLLDLPQPVEIKTNK
jgi:hypothetical protein